MGFKPSAALPVIGVAYDCRRGPHVLAKAIKVADVKSDESVGHVQRSGRWRDPCPAVEVVREAARRRPGVTVCLLEPIGRGCDSADFLHPGFEGAERRRFARQRRAILSDADAQGRSSFVVDGKT